MHKMFYASIGVLFLVSISGAYAQNMEEILTQIEQNNLRLKAWQSGKEANVELNKSKNRLPDPEIVGYYLNGNNNQPSAYTEVQVSQKIEFPTVYLNRSKLNQQKETLFDLEYQRIRQEVLLRSKGLCIQIIHLNQQLTHVWQRQQEARKVYYQLNELYQKGEVSVLKMNKGKLVWIQEQFKTDLLENKKKGLLLRLKQLNGGKIIEMDVETYLEGSILPPLEALIKTTLEKDPELRTVQQKSLVAKQDVKLQKAKMLPELSLGYNQQGVNNDRFSGVYGGLTIPLWKGTQKVKAAKAFTVAIDAENLLRQTKVKVELEKKYTAYQLLKKKYQEYTATLKTVNNNELLIEAYQAGQISFFEYYNEKKFYHEAVDKALSMEKELHLLKSQILKHQL